MKTCTKSGSAYRRHRIVAVSDNYYVALIYLVLYEVKGIIDHFVNVGRARGERFLSGKIQQIPYDAFGAINCPPNLIENLLVAFLRKLFEGSQCRGG